VPEKGNPSGTDIMKPHEIGVKPQKYKLVFLPYKDPLSPPSSPDVPRLWRGDGKFEGLS
jgi:hypothetical protein